MIHHGHGVGCVSSYHRAPGRGQELIHRYGLMTLLAVLALALLLWVLAGNRMMRPAAGRVRIATFASIGLGPLYIAQEEGFFKREGLAVEISPLEDLSALSRALAAG
jgi:ABC-type nitrate/sulfonate/bicarbonate transport system substrate-binding protein